MTDKSERIELSNCLVSNIKYIRRSSYGDYLDSFYYKIEIITECKTAKELMDISADRHLNITIDR